MYKSRDLVKETSLTLFQPHGFVDSVKGFNLCPEPNKMNYALSLGKFVNTTVLYLITPISFFSHIFVDYPLSFGAQFFSQSVAVNA